MIAVLDLDLAVSSVPVRVYGPAWVLVRHGDRILGEERLDFTTPLLLQEQRGALIRRYAARISAPESVGNGERVRPSTISVVVCTRDRPRMLEECLTALSALDPAPGEIVVVDNASGSADTKQIAARFNVKLATETIPGLNRARNRGLREATGEIVAYVDDDARVDRHFAVCLARAFGHPDVGAVTGLIRPAELGTYAQIAFERLEGGMGKGFSRRLFRSDDVGLQAFRVGVGTNMAFRRPVLEDLNGFDVRLDVGTETRGGGDLDMFWRVLRSGAVIQYEPDVLVRHVHRPDRHGLIAQLRDNGTGYAAFLEARRTSDPSLALAVRRERRRWHWSRHVVRPIRALLRGELLELQLALAEWRGSRHGPAALQRATTRPRVGT